MAADQYTATYEPTSGPGRFTAPEGLQQVVAVDGIYLGKTVEQYQNNPPRLVEKYAIVFQTADADPDTGTRYELSKEFTVSMHEKAGLRKFLSSWRGKAYTDEEAKRVPLHKTIGVNGMATVEHKVSAKGNTYAVITNITPLMRGVAPIEPEGYQRAAFWEDRKTEYLAKADAYVAHQELESASRTRAGGGTIESVRAAVEKDDDLPF